YGLGAVKPAPLPLGPWRARGYLLRGRTLAELATACGLPAEALQQTVRRYNAQARAGQDSDFAKGQTPYNRIQGDAERARQLGSSNPCMAPLARAPFYAVHIVMGSLGTFAGLRVDARARVLDAAGQPVAGLWAGGNDMSSLMAGHYPAGGITLGPAMTFGFLAACDAAGVEPDRFHAFSASSP
ncbi:MAG: FAD-binding protein, partial [Rhodoferax sp.]|nr:FAD-binding protein [Rhodoferax sp.]